MYLYFGGGLGRPQFSYLKKFFAESLSLSDSYKLGAQRELNPPRAKTGVCLGHNKGSEQ